MAKTKYVSVVHDYCLFVQKPIYLFMFLLINNFNLFIHIVYNDVLDI